MAEPNNGQGRPESAAEQARQQAERGELTVRVDQTKMTRSYANAFRTNGTLEEAG